ncbi:hypothetical protein NDU88_006329 [Pleurodeles waltl]|uniref:Uncharacterized protein n=1 Tax=Pleurodeles waltl TaxID=8319 RepID=A0AAV7LRN5_PLEWA|nr:hypothetical protein NDU88_006329 [Pleurodeles waltl]
MQTSADTQYYQERRLDTKFPAIRALQHTIVTHELQGGQREGVPLIHLPGLTAGDAAVVWLNETDPGGDLISNTIPTSGTDALK